MILKKLISGYRTPLNEVTTFDKRLYTLTRDNLCHGLCNLSYVTCTFYST